MHITPSEASPFMWKLNKTKVANDAIRDKSIIKISTRLVSIILRSIKIEIPNEEP